MPFCVLRPSRRTTHGCRVMPSRITTSAIVMTAMLAKATGTLGSVAHNLMSALIFALSAIGAYGVLYNLLAVAKNHQSPITNHRSSFFNLPLLGPLFLLFCLQPGRFPGSFA